MWEKYIFGITWPEIIKYKGKNVGHVPSPGLIKYITVSEYSLELLLFILELTFIYVPQDM